MSKVFVGNFSFSIDDEKLREYFEQAGTVVSAKVMKEGPGGRSRGFGFVEFATPEDSAAAIQKFDNQMWEGRSIKVSEDRNYRRDDGPRDSSFNGGNSGGGFGGGGYGGGGYGGGSYGGDEGGHRGGDRFGGGGYGDRGGDRGAAPGFFKAQPAEFGFKRRKKLDPFLEDLTLKVDYKDPKTLTRFMSERGRILPRRMTGLTSHNQRQVTRAIKRSQFIGLLPYSRE